MKRIEIDDELYSYIASHTQFIGESASDILRRLLGLSPSAAVTSITAPVATPETVVNEPVPAPVDNAAVADEERVFDHITASDLAAQKGKVGRFLYVLSVLHRCHRSSFEQVLAIRGRDRLYFARSEAALLQSGNSTNPKEIPGSGYWVITNSNTTKKKSMLTRVAEALGYSAEDAEKIRDFL